MEELSFYESLGTTNYLEREEVDCATPVSLIGKSILSGFKEPAVRQRLIEPIPTFSELCEAIHLGDLDSVRSLLSIGADPNGTDSLGLRPLYIATTPEMVALLIQYGADPNLGGEDSPLNYALKMGKFDLSEQMIRSGASLSLSRTEWKKGGDRELHLQRALAHASSISGPVQLKQKESGELHQAHEMDLEGGVPTEWVPAMAHALTELEREARLSHAEVSPLRQALHAIQSEDRSGKEILDEYKKGQPILLEAGFSGHSVIVLIVGNKLFLCNRGAASRRSVEAYSFNPERLDAALLERMKRQEIATPREYGTMVLKELAELECVQEKALEAKCALPMQTVGNCSYANLEAAVYSYLHAIDHPQARELFDNFSLRVRSNLFNEMLGAAREGEYELNMELAVRAAAQIGPHAQATLSEFQKSSPSGTWSYLKAIARTGHLRQLWS